MRVPIILHLCADQGALSARPCPGGATGVSNPVAPAVTNGAIAGEVGLSPSRVVEWRRWFARERCLD